MLIGKGCEGHDLWPSKKGVRREGSRAVSPAHDGPPPAGSRPC